MSKPSDSKPDSNDDDFGSDGDPAVDFGKDPSSVRHGVAKAGAIAPLLKSALLNTLTEGVERTMALVSFGALSLLEAATKLTYTPSRMLGLLNKGHFSEGADGDVTVIDRTTGKASMSFVNGEPIMKNGRVVGSGGTWLVTSEGEKTAAASGLPYEVINLEQSKLYAGWR